MKECRVPSCTSTHCLSETFKEWPWLVFVSRVCLRSIAPCKNYPIHVENIIEWKKGLLRSRSVVAQPVHLKCFEKNEKKKRTRERTWSALAQYANLNNFFSIKFDDRVSDWIGATQCMCILTAQWSCDCCSCFDPLLKSLFGFCLWFLGVCEFFDFLSFIWELLL